MPGGDCGKQVGDNLETHRDRTGRQARVYTTLSPTKLAHAVAYSHELSRLHHLSSHLTVLKVFGQNCKLQFASFVPGLLLLLA